MILLSRMDGNRKKKTDLKEHCDNICGLDNNKNNYTCHRQDSFIVKYIAIKCAYNYCNNPIKWVNFC